MAEKTVQSTPAQTVAAHARGLHIAPRKLRLVANAVRKQRVADALVQLSFMNKKGAEVVSKLLRSAVANAEHNFSLDPAGLFIESITCDAAQVMKRYMPRARGSSSPLNRRMSHLHVVLGHSGKTAKTAPSRFAALARKTKSEQKKLARPADETSAAVAQTDAHKPGEAVKPAEVIKQQKVQQKRRLFNRKSGE